MRIGQRTAITTACFVIVPLLAAGCDSATPDPAKHTPRPATGRATADGTASSHQVSVTQMLHRPGARQASPLPRSAPPGKAALTRSDPKPKKTTRGKAPPGKTAPKKPAVRKKAKPRPPAQRSAAAARACGTLPGYDPKAVSALMAGRLTITGFPAVTVDPHRDGHINWRQNPFRDPTWFQDFQSGGWVVELIAAYEANGPYAGAYRTRAAALIRGWLRAVPLTGRDPLALVCMSQAFPGQQWIQSQVAPAVNNYAANWQGAWNHGLYQDLDLLRIGCGYPAGAFGGAALRWRRTAVTQLIASFKPNSLGPAIDLQGATNEQSTLYSNYVLNLWRRGLPELAACGYKLPGWIMTRIARLQAFLGYATEPDGNLVQLGDTYVERSAVQNKQKNLVAVYKAGYVFGRSSWSKNASFYSLRFGGARQIHGHHDHTSLTYFARGHDLIVNAGHNGYAKTAYRSYLRSPEASSDLVMPGVPYDEEAPTVMVKDKVGKQQQFYELFDTAFDGDSRTRSVYVDQRPDLMLVYDQGAGAHSYQQLWHLAPQLRVTSLTRSEAIAEAPGTELVIRQISLPGQPVPPGSTHVLRARFSPYQGWFSPQLRQRMPDDVVTMSRTGPSADILTLIVPAAPGTPISTKITGPRYGPYRLDVHIGRNKTTSFAISANGTIGGRG